MLICPLRLKMFGDCGGEEEVSPVGSEPVPILTSNRSVVGRLSFNDDNSLFCASSQNKCGDEDHSRKAL
jgi:hypothetical protein